MYDYAVVSQKARAFLQEVVLDDSADSKAHYGIVISFRFCPEAALEYKLLLLKPFAQAARPKKEADKNNKRSRQNVLVKKWPALAKQTLSVKRPFLQKRLRYKGPPPLAYHDPEDDLGDESDPTTESEEETPPPETQPEDEAEQIGSPEAGLGEPKLQNISSTAHDSNFKEALWQDISREAAANPDARWATPPEYIRASPSFRATAADATNLGRDFGKWVSTLEVFQCEVLQIRPADREAHKGRGLARRIAHRPCSGILASHLPGQWGAMVVNYGALPLGA